MITQEKGQQVAMLWCVYDLPSVTTEHFVHKLVNQPINLSMYVGWIGRGGDWIIQALAEVLGLPSPNNICPSRALDKYMPWKMRVVCRGVLDNCRVGPHAALWTAPELEEDNGRGSEKIQVHATLCG